eukprot:CAMPEP_0196600672 /NCGR_PEP_ID=MMETSP1081-20130531/95511_1 /TAXON_ID=36882 /ORGANISM="Pyramimonas amylifera, Strain CCMP720" /LENGTH=103 /DNA_ID=CAMNT_0041926521 /DNA_START=651 /DNA_END=959 /DNA_ORIENTATION=-
MQIPKVVHKQDLLSSKDLGLLGGSASKLAAVDYLVCLYAEVFMPTLGGNMGHQLRVHRSYLGRYNLFPNKEALAQIYSEGGRFGLGDFNQEVRASHPSVDLRW